MNPGQLPAIFFAHANGFPAPSYGSFLKQLSPYEIDYVESFGQNNPKPGSWEEVADELIQGIESRHKKAVIGVGHSFGGVATYFAARRRPDLFSQIILLDPPFFSWKRRWLIAPFQWLGIAHKVVPPARKALTRKDRFTSIQEAEQYFSKKKFFQSFAPEAFQDYLTHGLVKDDEGVTLRISKQKEAQYFAGLPIRIGDTALTMPAHFIFPEGNGIIPESHLEEIQSRFSAMTWHPTPGNHMFPLEHPQKTANLILSLL